MHPLRLLQLFAAGQESLPLVCVNVVGGASGAPEHSIPRWTRAVKLGCALVTECSFARAGGYDFAAVGSTLRSLPSRLPRDDFSTLQEALAEDGVTVGQLVRSLSRTISNSISVFFNPGTRSACTRAA